MQNNNKIYDTPKFPKKVFAYQDEDALSNDYFMFSTDPTELDDEQIVGVYEYKGDAVKEVKTRHKLINLVEINAQS